MSIYVALLAGCVLTMILGKFVLAELRKLKLKEEQERPVQLSLFDMIKEE